MPEYLALRCYQCRKFQVQQKKKTPKWKCVVCQAQQSVVKVFGIASQASHLRPLVQEYNMKQGEADAEEHFKAVERAYGHAEAIKREALNPTRAPPSVPKQNEWEQYLDEPKYQVNTSAAPRRTAFTDPSSDDLDPDDITVPVAPVWSENRATAAKRKGPEVPRNNNKSTASSSSPTVKRMKAHEVDMAAKRTFWTKQNPSPRMMLREEEEDYESEPIRPAMIPAAARAVLPESGPRPKIAPAAPPGPPTSTERASIENELLERLKANIYISQEAADIPQKSQPRPSKVQGKQSEWDDYVDDEDGGDDDGGGFFGPPPDDFDETV